MLIFMRVCIVAIGTRGDFELFLFLGQELRARGHQVVMGSSPFNERYVRASGIDWMPVGTGTHAEALAVLRGMGAIPDRSLRVWEYVSRWIQPQINMALDQIQAAAEQSDYFINNLRKTLERGSDTIPGAFVIYDPPANIQREAWLAGQQAPGKVLELVALNKHLVDPQDQWDSKYCFTGFWQAPQPTVPEPSPELVAFLKAGAPPVVVTLGSMVMFDPNEAAEDISDALELAGQRGIVVGGWSQLTQAAHWSGSVLCVPEAPYEWLFPQASCIIHHGGTGTVGAVLRAGKVSIVMPQIKPQETYAWILGQNGLAAGMFDVTNLYIPELTDAICRAVTDPELQRKARAWQQIVAGDPGVRRAADLIEEHMRALQAR
jgi:UDP:flavonoid glycosyltransferase YjiC (YdhE family)